MGLVAIAASMKGAREVIATDGDSELLSTLTEQNIESNVPQGAAPVSTAYRMSHSD